MCRSVRFGTVMISHSRADGNHRTRSRGSRRLKLRQHVDTRNVLMICTPRWDGLREVAQTTSLRDSAHDPVGEFAEVLGQLGRSAHFELATHVQDL
jgi:hypothetical protein